MAGHLCATVKETEKAELLLHRAGMLGLGAGDISDSVRARNALTYHNTYVSRLKEAQQTSMRANALVLIPLLMLIPLQLTHVCLDPVSILHVYMIL